MAAGSTISDFGGIDTTAATSLPTENGETTITFTGKYPADVNMTNVTVLVSATGGFSAETLVQSATPTTLAIQVFTLNDMGMPTGGIHYSVAVLH